MLQNKYPKISVVIPIYNEEKFIGHCLDALNLQTVKPYEIIVVNNNCTDLSLEIIKKYGNVKVINEPKQGLSYARNTGYSFASGDVIARLDADTFVYNNFTNWLQDFYMHNNNVAVSSYCKLRTELIPYSSKLGGWCYAGYTESYLGHKVLFGGLMAFQKKYWHKIEPILINDDFMVHEDQDISLALASVGVSVIQNKIFVASVNAEKPQHISTFYNYVKRLRNTKKLDKTHYRYKLSTRLPNSSNLRRALLWFLTVWSIYVWYGITAFYSLYCIILPSRAIKNKR